VTGPNVSSSAGHGDSSVSVWEPGLSQVLATPVSGTPSPPPPPDTTTTTHLTILSPQFHIPIIATKQTSFTNHPTSQTNHCHPTDLIHPSPPSPILTIISSKKNHLSLNFKTNSINSSKNCSIFHLFLFNLIA